MLDPRRLMTFRAVAHERSFSRAAEQLSLTQPAVSQHVAALERTIGARLLHRGPGGVVPTEAGELLLDHADAIADRLALATGQLGEVAAAGRSRLRVGAFGSALATIVPVALGALHDADPGLEVDVTEAGGEALVPAVARGDLHAAVIFDDAARGPRDLPPALRREPLLDEPFVAAVGPRHPLAGRGRIALADLRDDPWTAPSRDGLLARAARAAGFEAQIAYVTSDPLAIARFVGAGLAVTITPRLLGDALPGVVRLELADAPRRSVAVISPVRGRHALVAPFVRALRAAVA